MREGSTAPIKISLCEKDDKGVEHVIGTSIVDPSTIENKQYELALKNASNGELGKLYLECDAEWVDKKSPRNAFEPEEEEEFEPKPSSMKSGVNSYKSAAGSDNEDLSRRIK